MATPPWRVCVIVPPACLGVCFPLSTSRVLICLQKYKLWLCVYKRLRHFAISMVKSYLYEEGFLESVTWACHPRESVLYPGVWLHPVLQCLILKQLPMTSQRLWVYNFTPNHRKWISLAFWCKVGQQNWYWFLTSLVQPIESAFCGLRGIGLLWFLVGDGKM